MVNDAVTGLAFEGCALTPVTGISKRLLPGTLGNGKTLQADSKPRVIHHPEHDGQSLIFLTDQIADGTIIITIGKHRCR